MLLSFLFFSTLGFAQVQTDSRAALEASQAAATAEATLDLEWEKIEDAAAYEVKLTPATGGAPLKFTSTSTQLTQKLPLGSYKLQIRSKDKSSGFFGPWSPETDVEVQTTAVQLILPKEGAEISEPKQKRATVNFEWSPIKGAKEYTLRIWFDDEKNAREFKSTTNKKTLTLPTAKAYAWQVTFLTDKSIGYLAAPQIGNFKVLGKQLLKPVILEKLFSRNEPEKDASKETQKNRKEDELAISSSEQFLKWKPTPNAKTYDIKLFSKALDEDEWHELKTKSGETSTEFDLDKLAAANYKLEVIAKAPNRVSSEPGVYQFTVKPTAVELANAMKKAL